MEHRTRVAETVEQVTSEPGASEAPLFKLTADNQFDFYKQWYPVYLVDSLDAKYPVNVAVCGIEMVIWGDGKGNWHCMEDKCSHRLAPLSEGRVTKEGNLECAYHGWEFSSQGKLQRIPQIVKDPTVDDKGHDRACSRECAAVRVFPTKMEHGMLWVWPQSGLEALADSSASVGAMHPGTVLWGDDMDMIFQPFMRDLPLGFDMLLENVIDPSHVPFSHHGIQGNRFKLPPTTYRRTTDISFGGFSVNSVREMDGKKSSTQISFIAPGLVLYNTGTGAAWFQVTPTRPGWSRICALFFSKRDSPKTSGKMKVIQWLGKKLVALDHALNRNEVLDGDTFFLHQVERTLMHGHGNDWKKAYYMPASADLGVVAARTWLERYGGVLPTAVKSASELPPLLSKQQALNRYEQHVKGCKHCKQALKTLDWVRIAAAAAAAVAVVTLTASWVAAKPLLTAGNGALVLVAALGALAVVKLGGLRQKFFFSDYIHADH